LSCRTLGGHAASIDEVPCLLARNFRDGDRAAVERVVESAAHGLDDHEMHRVCFGLQRLIEGQPLTELLPLALWVYAHTPCGLCRRDAIDAVRTLKQLPAWLVEEMTLNADACELATGV
jgi:hypothetical protein